MEARILRVTLLALAASLLMGASYRTPNFVVSADTQAFAKQVGDMAEQYRKQMAEEWLGAEMPRWARPCPITVQAGAHLGAGGATSFNFHRGEVFGWHMEIQGSRQRIIDSVLPHEVTHTVFASHFRQPLPRWADEGACTTVEHYSERTKQQRMLIQFLQTGRGIAFSRMFRMKEYPRDVLPLYAQGHSLVSFLLAQGGKRKFVQYLETGLQDENWTAATKRMYGYGNLAALQQTWVDWVRGGSRLPLENAEPKINLASNTTPAAEEAPTEPEPPQQIPPARELVPVTPVAEQGRSSSPGPGKLAAPSNAFPEEGWFPAGTRDLDPRFVAEPPAVASRQPENAATHNQSARPQPVQPARQIILEWNRGNQQPSAYIRQPQGGPPASAQYDAPTQPPGRFRR